MMTFWNIFKTTATNPCLKDRPAVIFNDGQTIEDFSYEVLYQKSEEIYSKLIFIVGSGETIGLIMNHTPLLPAMIAAIHKCCSSFIIFDSSKPFNENIILELGISKIIALTHENIYNGFKSTTLKFALGNNLFLWTKTQPQKSCMVKQETIAYYIRTSGSTGIAKIVGVTHECINPNVKDFKSIFNVTTNDVIYFSTPLTFDPSIIELYLAAISGAALMISPWDVNVLFLQKYPITIWQTTPSKFIRLSKEHIRNIILNKSSSLRVLALGGEAFNCFENLRILKHPDNVTEVYNLYGITEVSCWASCSRVEFNNPTENYELCLGQPLSETLLKIIDDNKLTITAGKGEIFIGSRNRKCIVGSEVPERLMKVKKEIQNVSEPIDDQILWRETGDLGIILDGNIYFKGRRDRIIKRYGNRVNLLDIEIMSLKFPGIDQCSCIWNAKNNVLILFYTCYSSHIIVHADLTNYLKNNLDEYSIPDDVLRIPEIPINKHGKVSEKKLINTYITLNRKYENLQHKELFSNILNEFLPETRNSNDIHTKSFLDFGGTSILAILLVNKMERLTDRTYPELLTDLLNASHPLLNIIQYLNDDKYPFYPKCSANEMSFSTDGFDKKLGMTNKRRKMEFDTKLPHLKLSVQWKFNLGKCIDANPVIYCNISGPKCVLVGSHSGNVAAFSALSGDILQVYNVSSRVEAPFLCFESNHSSYATVGCYNGFLWCFSLPNLLVIWKVYLNAMIKSQTCFFENIIFAANYDSIVWALCAHSGEKITSLQVGKKGITSDLLCSQKGLIFLTTLDGICCCLYFNENNLKAKWKNKFSSPIFTKPVFLREESQIIFSEVNKKINCLNAETGNLLWTFETGGPIFSSCLVQSRDNNNYISFGCHDHHIYILIYSEMSTTATLLKKVFLSSEVYATPCTYNNETVVCACTDGNLYLCDVSSGTIKGRYSLPSQVYSSPVVSEKFIYIGCRDDYMYCLKIQE